MGGRGEVTKGRQGRDKHHNDIVARGFSGGFLPFNAVKLARRFGYYNRRGLSLAVGESCRTVVRCRLPW